ncbi:MAG: alpha/beta hydrolase [Verrucomicrobiota bacterium]|nr:alpha/beta hydrolase [Limisphaera sp.]MDW8381258.1 alpha/beta hydrolase [Verrucomicrobiota bacterium]
MRQVSGLVVRHYHSEGRPVLVYLPGIHGDWTLVTSFRLAVWPAVSFVELAYPEIADWQMADYATAVAEALERMAIEKFWVLAESFGSLVAWALLEQCSPDAGVSRGRAGLLNPDGLILAGGFVRHPWPWGALGLAALGRRMPQPVHHHLLRGYARIAGWRHRHAPETIATVEEFIARRTPENRRAIQARLRLVARADYRRVAAQTQLPVYALAGALDPLVPWWLVWPWLRSHCPGFRETRLWWWADHNVLGTAPRQAAAAVLGWMNVL